MKVIEGRDIVYYIDEEKKTTMVEITNCKHEFIVRLRKKIAGNNAKVWHMFYPIIDLTGIQDVYNCKVSCHPEDEYNQVYGMDIARTKALERRDAAFEKGFLRNADNLHVMVDGVISAFKANEDVSKCHLKNYNMLYMTGLPLKEAKKQILTNTVTVPTDAGERQAVPHYCEICGNTALNIVEDANFKKNESQWVTLVHPDSQKKFEVCFDCVDKIIQKDNT